jgi:hypothetical protein
MLSAGCRSSANRYTAAEDWRLAWVIRTLVGLLLIVGCSTPEPANRLGYVDSLLKGDGVQTMQDSIFQILTAHRDGKISADEAATAFRVIADNSKESINIELPADIRAALMRQQAGDTSMRSD